MQVGSRAMPTIEAARTVGDIIADSGDRGDEVSGWASLGHAGNCPQNAHRDLVRCAKTHGPDLQVATVSVTYRNIRDHGTTQGVHHCLYPHEVFAAIYDNGPENIEKILLGSEGESGLEAFWNQQSDQTWVREHPAFRTGGDKNMSFRWVSMPITASISPATRC